MKRYRYFGGLAKTQEKWLNHQSCAGWRLIQTGKLSYEFESCQPGEYQYCVEYVGYLSHSESVAYKRFMEELGYRVWYKNINLQWSTGKVQYRPWANQGGRIATSGTTIDRELMIVEKRNDGTPFVLHSTLEDRIGIVTRHRNSWLMMALIFLGCGLLLRSAVFCIASAVLLVPAILYHFELRHMKREAQIEE